MEAKGTPENPLIKEGLEEKFRRLATVVLREDEAEEFIKAVRNLEGVSDISTLVRLLVR